MIARQVFFSFFFFFSFFSLSVAQITHVSTGFLDNQEFCTRLYMEIMEKYI